MTGRTGTLRRFIVAAALAVAGWMVFDGIRALLLGDYVTPATGEHAGQLGPWAGLVSLVGIDPRSTAMKATFVAYGIAWLAVIAAFVAGLRRSRGLMVTAAAGALWYLPFGTLFGLLQIGLLLLPRMRPQS